MPTWKRVFDDTSYRPLAGPRDWSSTIITPKSIQRESDGGGIDFYLWNDQTSSGGAPSSLVQVREEGSEYAVSEQIQLGSGGTTVGVGTYYGSAKPHQALPPSTTLAGKPEPVYAFDPTTGDILAEAWVTASYAQPSIGSSVTLSCDDSSPFSGFSTGQVLYTSSGVYTLQPGSTFGVSGTLVAQWTGSGAVLVGTAD
jgi:hypothetical protein